MNNNFYTLELHKILEMLSDRASNETTKAMARELEPITDFDLAKKELTKTSDAFTLACKFGTPPFYNFKNISEQLNRAENGGRLTLKEILDVGYMLRQSREITEWYKQCSETETSLSYLFGSIIPEKSFEKRIEMSILSEEELADTASDELANIRRKIVRSGAKVREHLDKMLKSSSVQKSLQENLITIRDGRYVLPVKAEHKNNVDGLVHDTSSSGATLFIEPMAVVEENNNIRVLKGLEQEEIDRIIKELSRECGRIAKQLISNTAVIAELNLYFSKANLGADMKGSIPEISSDGGVFLKKARHPLLDSKTAVPITISIGGDYQALIITGPNTGGKTVALKTVGLLTAMAMCGMMIPADDGSSVTIFKHVLADIGDEQSIEQSLSTFSAHITKVAEIIRTADSNSLVLLDELGSGTDPVEGAALAVSIIENLKSKGAKLMVTTHYQELKMYALQNDNVENASCEFDVATLRPTYRLIVGTPGKSNAFAISSRLGIDRDILDYAEELVSTENKRFEDIIEQLENTRRELEEKLSEAEKMKLSAEHDRDEAAKKLKIIEDTRDAELEKARNQAMRIVESVQNKSDELLDELAELRKQKEKENFDKLSIEAKTKAKSALNEMYTKANPIVERKSDYTLPRPLRRGDTVHITDMKKDGIVAGDADANGFIFVQAGVMKTKIHIDKLRLLDTPKSVQKKKSPSKSNVQSRSERRVQLELDIRGQAADEGVFELQRFIDNAVMSGVGMITVIHGKGTGILRNAVHRELKSNPCVKSFRLGMYGEGEDGVTIVELK